MDSKPKPKIFVHQQAKANREVVTTPLIKLYQTNQPRLGTTFARTRSTMTWVNPLDRPQKVRLLQIGTLATHLPANCQFAPDACRTHTLF